MSTLNQNIRYEPSEPCSAPVLFSVAIQGAMIAAINTVLMVTIVVRASGQNEAYLSWAIFVALVIGGVVTALQAARIRRFGAGHLLLCGAGPHFIAISVLALNVGGWATLASLIVISSLFQFAFAASLPFLRRFITPVVCGTSLILIAVSVISVAMDKLVSVPEGISPSAPPLVLAATLGAAVLTSLKGSGFIRLWAPLVGVLAGCMVAAFFNLYDLDFVLQAKWFDFPEISSWPGFDLSLGVDFWTLLPTFVILTLVVAVKTSGDGVVIQQVSLRRIRAIDFRVVQGTVNANGLGVFLSGLAGAPAPTVAYSPSSISLISLTGVAFRRIGFVSGIFLVALAFFPKFTAFLLAAPTAVLSSLLLMVMGMLLVEGMRMVFQEGLDHQDTLVVGVALAIGIGLESLSVFVMEEREPWVSILGNGTTIGILVMVTLKTVLEIANPRSRRLEVSLETPSLPRIDEFLQEYAVKIGWSQESTQRLRAAGEETLLSLLSPEISETQETPVLIVVVRARDEDVEMEFVSVFEEENIEDRLAYMSEEVEVHDDRELSFRILRHLASSVQHRKYHGVDIVTVLIKGSK